MASSRVLRALVTAFVSFLIVVSAQKTSSKAAVTATVATFETTFKPFPTNTGAEFLTTIDHPAADPTVLATETFFPLRQGIDVHENVSYFLNFTSDSNDIATTCWYPISGNWGLLPRILFYVTILAALILRHHQWLYAGALVASLTYSGVAAIQACLMVWRGPSLGDLDMIPLLAILTTSCILTVPLLNWSETLRNIGNDEAETEKNVRQHPYSSEEKSDQEFGSAARTIVLYWAFLVLVGFLCTFVAVVPVAFDEYPLPTNWFFLTLSGNDNITCTPPGGELDLSAGQPGSENTLFLTAEFIDANACTNPCSIPPPDARAIFRSPQDLQPLTQENVVRFFLGDDHNQKQRVDDHFSDFYLTYGTLILPYVFLQGIWAAIFGRRTPGQARNVIYALVTRVRLSRSRRPLDPAPPFQKATAKFLALLSYLWAVFILVLSVPLFVLNVCGTEIYMVRLASSENNNHVGAWGPWASVTLTLLAALFGRFHNEIGYILALSAYKFAWLAAHPSWLFLRCCGGPKRKQYKARNIFSGDYEDMPDRYLYRNTAGDIFTEIFGSIFALVVGGSTGVWQTLRNEWLQLVEFILDPDLSRSNQGRIHRLQATHCGCILGCQCPEEQVHPECRHEKGICLEYKQCHHDPPCCHGRDCIDAKTKAQRLRLLNPERRTVALALGPLHGGKLALDITGTPIPLRAEESRYRPIPFSQRRSVDGDSEVDEKRHSRSIALPKWHDSVHRKNTIRNQKRARSMFSRKPEAARTISRPMPFTDKSDETTYTARSQLVQADQDPGGGFAANKAVNVSEQPIHPLLRDSYVSQYAVSPIEQSPLVAAPPPARVTSEAEMSRSKSMAKGLPAIPQEVMRAPNSTPNNDARSLASGVSALSRVPTNGAEPKQASERDSISQLRPSLKETAQNNSNSSNGTKRSATNPSPVEANSSNPSPKPDPGRSRYSVGLTSSFEQGIMSRQRRSQAYGPDIPRERDPQSASSSAPIPVHLEEPQREAAAPAPAELPTVRTPASHSEALAPPFSDPPKRDPPAQEDEEEPAEVPPPLRVIPQLSSLPLSDFSSGEFLSPQDMRAFLDSPVAEQSPSDQSLSAREIRALFGPPSDVSTPPVTLPPLSPPDPQSNVARAASGSLQNRNPHLSLGSVINKLNHLTRSATTSSATPVWSPLSPDVPSNSIPETEAGSEQTAQRSKSVKSLKRTTTNE